MMSIHLLMIITRSLVKKTDIIFDERHTAQIRKTVVSHFGSVDQNVIFQELIKLQLCIVFYPTLHALDIWQGNTPISVTILLSETRLRSKFPVMSQQQTLIFT